MIIKLQGKPAEMECKIVVTRDGAEVYNAMVTTGTSQITIPGQTGLGLVKYTVSALTPDGQAVETWEVEVNFD